MCEGHGYSGNTGGGAGERGDRVQLVLQMTFTLKSVAIATAVCSRT